LCHNGEYFGQTTIANNGSFFRKIKNIFAIKFSVVKLRHEILEASFDVTALSIPA